jgi:hypothetical protein
MNTTLHIPINKAIKEKAEAVVKEQGYSSLQEVLRVLVFSLAKGEVKTAFIDTDVQQILTAQQERHLNLREEQTRKAINQGTAHGTASVKEMMTILENTSHKHE